MIKNSFISLIQSLVSIVSLFFTYKFIISKLGVEQLGLWSLLISILAFVRVAECGFSGSVIKFISAALANTDAKKIKFVLETSIISVAVLIGLTSILIFLPVKILLPTLISDQFLLIKAYQILPICLFSIWMSSVAGIYKASLEGCQRYDLSMYAAIISTVVFIVAVVVLIPKDGIMGLALALCLQSLVLFFIALFFLNYSLRIKTFFPFRWSLSVFKEMSRYGSKYQIISIVTILIDPLTKGMLGHFGNLTMVGYYEMANKVITQMRSLLLSMNQVIVPNVAYSQEAGTLNLRVLYEKNCQMIVYISIPFYIAILTMIPLIQDIWIGNRSIFFELFSVLSVLTWFFNTLTIPAYLINMGTGDLNWNVVSHLVMGIMNLILSVILGWYFGGLGVVVAWSFSIIIGSLLVMYKFHVKNSIPFFIKTKINFFSLVSGAVIVMIGWKIYYYYNFFDIKRIIFIVIYLFFMLFLSCLFVWFNPQRKVLVDIVFSFFRKK